MKDAGTWRPLEDAVRLAELDELECVPYVSAQFEGDGALIDGEDNRSLFRLWATLDYHEVDEVIAWGNGSQDTAVESFRRCVFVFGEG